MSGTFQTFGVSHLVMLSVFVAGISPAVWLGRTGLDQRRVSKLLAFAICCFTIPMQAVDFLPGQYDAQTTWPLQLCDFAWVAAVAGLWTHRRTPVALTYYWGLVLTTQAVLTPWLSRDFPDPKFVGFWGMHLLIVWAAIYLTWGLRLRPSWRGYASTVAITFGWLVSVFCVNLLAGTNYGFVIHKPSSASVLDYLGPWPVYLVVEIAIVASVWAIMTWPWTRRVEPTLTARTNRPA